MRYIHWSSILGDISHHILFFSREYLIGGLSAYKIFGRVGGADCRLDFQLLSAIPWACSSRTTTNHGTIRETENQEALGTYHLFRDPKISKETIIISTIGLNHSTPDRYTGQNNEWPSLHGSLDTTKLDCWKGTTEQPHISRSACQKCTGMQKAQSGKIRRKAPLHLCYRDTFQWRLKKKKERNP